MNNFLLAFVIILIAGEYILANELMKLQNNTMATSSQIVRLNQVAEKLLSVTNKLNQIKGKK